MVRTKTITQIGYIVSGTATVSMWGGGSGTIEMNRTFIPLEKFSKTNTLRCVNDGGFGVESIDAADIDIYVKYDNGSVEIDRTIYDVSHPLHTKHFLGWKELRAEGIK